MTHNCIDWDAIPLRFLTISCGNKKVVTRKGATSKVREFKSLQSFAHRKFSIQDRQPSSLCFRTTCNLSLTPCEDNSGFEVDKEAWEEEGLVDLVCCLEVYLEDVVPGPLPGEDALQPVEEDHEYTWVDEKVQDSDEREDGEGGRRNVAEVKDNVEEHEAHDETENEQEEKEEEQDEIGEKEQTDEKEEITVRTRPSRRRRQVIVSDDEDSPISLDHISRLATDLQQTQKAAVVDGSQPLAPGARNRTIAARAQDMPRVPDTEQPIKKEQVIPSAHRVRVSSIVGSSQEGRAPFGTHKPLGQHVKQEPNSSSAGQMAHQPQANQTTQESEPAPELAHTKLVISIQHKPSAQHAQFSTKPHTRIGKVLAGACKSFRLDVNVAQLYLVVVTQNDQGLKEQDYFLCDRNETVEDAVVGVEGRAEFMIRMPEDPAM